MRRKIKGNKLQCTRCKEFKDFEDFAVNNSSSSGRQNMCRSCHHEYNTSESRRKRNTEYHKQYRERNKVAVSKDKKHKDTDLLKCSDCGKKKKAGEHFYKNPSIPRQYSYKCKECTLLYNRNNRVRRKGRDYDKRYHDKSRKLSPIAQGFHSSVKNKLDYFVLLEVVSSEMGARYLITNNIPKRIYEYKRTNNIEVLSHKVLKASNIREELYEERKKIKKK